MRIDRIQVCELATPPQRVIALALDRVPAGYPSPYVQLACLMRHSACAVNFSCRWESMTWTHEAAIRAQPSSRSSGGSNTVALTPE